MIEFCEKIMYYTSGIRDQAAFLADERTYDATLRNLELIGEAARHIPASVREPHIEIPWRDIIGMRNQLAMMYRENAMYIISTNGQEPSGLGRRQVARSHKRADDLEHPRAQPMPSQGVVVRSTLRLAEFSIALGDPLVPVVP